jgi:hypothetical protein
LQAVQGTDAEWRKELDRHFLLALKEQLFWPIKGRMRSGGKSRVGERLYRPILYSIVRGPAVGPVSDDTAESYQRPRSVTIVLTPEPLAQRRAKPQSPPEHPTSDTSGGRIKTE